MFCRNCGNELSEDQQFCPKCGTKSGDSNNPASTNVSAEYIMNKAKEIKGKVVAETARLGKNKVLLFANVALLVLSWIFAAMPTFKAEAFGFSQAESMLSDNASLQFFSVAIYIASVACLLLPLLLKIKWDKLFFLPAKITTIISIAWFLLLFFIGSQEAQKSVYVDFSPTATGWLFLITTVGALVLSFKLAAEFEKDTPNGENTTPTNSGSFNA